MKIIDRLGHLHKMLIRDISSQMRHGVGLGRGKIEIGRILKLQVAYCNIVVELRLVCVNPLEDKMYRYGRWDCLGMGLPLIMRAARKNGARRAAKKRHLRHYRGRGRGEPEGRRHCIHPPPHHYHQHHHLDSAASPITTCSTSNMLWPHWPVGTLLVERSARPQLKFLIVLQLVASEMGSLPYK